MHREKKWYHLKGYEEGELAGKAIEHAHSLERRQTRMYDEFHRLACLYDPHSVEQWVTPSGGRARGAGRVIENVVASNVDTVQATIAPAKVRPRILTDHANWKEKRQARWLSWYGEALGKKIRSHELKVEGVKQAALKGTGLCKVVPDYHNECVRAVEVLPEDLIVNESHCRTWPHWPRQLFHWEKFDRDELMARYPKKAEKIEAAYAPLGGSQRQNDDEDPDDDSQIAVLCGWSLPIGKKGKKGYIPGRYVECIDGVELLDEEYHDNFFPIARIAWTTRAGFFGIGGSSRIKGHQSRITKMNWQADRCIDLNAMPTTYVHRSDANLHVKSRNDFGNIGLYNTAIPKTVAGPSLSGEFYARLDRLGEKSYEEFGTSRMAATSRKPAGLDSGAAIREYKDIHSGRFAMQEEGAERYELDIIWLGIVACKRLSERGIEPPTLGKKLASGTRKLRWADVEPENVRLTMYAAASLGRTPAGRTQSVLEFSQAGLFTTDEARRLLAPHDSLDLNATLSVYQAHMDELEMIVEEMLDGAVHVPEPHQNYELGRRFMMAAKSQAKQDGAPEDVQEALRQWATLASDKIKKAKEQTAAMGAPMPEQMMMPPIPGGPEQPAPMPAQ